eukprot:IDg19411t1
MQCGAASMGMIRPTIASKRCAAVPARCDEFHNRANLAALARQRSHSRSSRVRTRCTARAGARFHKVHVSANAVRTRGPVLSSVAPYFRHPRGTRAAHRALVSSMSSLQRVAVYYSDILCAVLRTLSIPRFYFMRVALYAVRLPDLYTTPPFAPVMRL